MSILLACLSAYPVLLHKAVTQAAERAPISELQRLEQQLANSVNAAQRRAVQLASEVVVYENNLAQFLRQNEVALTLTYLGVLSDALALQIKSIKPIATQASRLSKFDASDAEETASTSNQFLTQKFDLVLYAEYYQLLEFLLRIAQSSYVAVIEEIAITGDEKSPLLNARLRLKLHFFHGEVAGEMLAKSQSEVNDQAIGQH